VIEAYIDESSTHWDAPFLCVACYFGPHSRWRAFERQWQPILKEHEIKSFHAKNGKHDKVRPFLAKIIEDCKFKGVMASVSRSVYNQFASAQLRSGLGDPYAACVSQCVMKTCRLVKIYHPDKKVSFFIEAGQPKTERIEASFKSMIGRAFGAEFAPIAGVALVKKEDFTPLQTADFLSHVYGTQDMTCFNYLTRRRLIWLASIGPEILEDTSSGVKIMLAEQRWRRHLEKKQTKTSAPKE